MRSRGVRAAGLWLLGGLLTLSSAGSFTHAGDLADAPLTGRQQPLTTNAPEIRLPLEELSPDVREKVRQVLDRPALTVRGPAESFNCVPATYHWLLEHPDRGVLIWRRLGARCVDIASLGNGTFGWSDTLGSELTWTTVHQTPRMRVFYASGHVKPGMLLPRVPVQAVVVIHYTEDGQVTQSTTMKHQAEMAVHTDSRAVSAAARLMGASAQRVGEQYMGQLQMFYGALAWYLDQPPEQADTLVNGVGSK
jgi:hypothetical protein